MQRTLFLVIFCLIFTPNQIGAENCDCYYYNFYPLDQSWSWKNWIEHFEKGLNCIEYDKEEYPSKTNVTVVEALMQINPEEIIPLQSQISIELILYFSWVDQRLAWPSECLQNWTYLYAPSYKLWHPNYRSDSLKVKRDDDIYYEGHWEVVST